ncbi:MULTISPECIES: hypothetical protein [unclassified Synechococcus]|nr:MULTISPECIES: hypothetical protein [unclassified Synechococcus]
MLRGNDNWLSVDPPSHISSITDGYKASQTSRLTFQIGVRDVPLV